jgi:hypothetical protein
VVKSWSDDDMALRSWRLFPRWKNLSRSRLNNMHKCPASGLILSGISANGLVARQDLCLRFVRYVRSLENAGLRPQAFELIWPMLVRKVPFRCVGQIRVDQIWVDGTFVPALLFPLHFFLFVRFCSRVRGSGRGRGRGVEVEGEGELNIISSAAYYSLAAPSSGLSATFSPDFGGEGTWSSR